LVDTNILMYAVGAEHPFKRPSIAFLGLVASGETEATIDAEVLQELLHRYRSINRWREAGEVYALTRQLFPLVLPVTAEIVDEAKRLMDRYDRLLARDAIHTAVVAVHDLAGICSYDRDFDGIKGLRRIQPVTPGL
jgi:predicted nucleic acid-binding protein